MANDLAGLRTRLSPRYEIEREVGRGGTSTVYLARDTKHGRDVAVKVLRHDVTASVGLERFRREIQIAASLQHPNVLPLLDSGEVDGVPYFVAPYVEGASLRDLLERRSRLPVDEACRIAGEVAAGLGYAHAQGIVHRDVKPGNILLSDGHPLLADFGLARAATLDVADRLTTTDGAGGTVQYMSPEQLHGTSEPDARSDVYSLACVVFEMLTGEPPFTGRTAWSVMARQISGEAESVRVTRPDLPAATAAVLACALSTEPSARFPTPGAFTSALEDSLAAGGGRARRPFLPRRVVAGVLGLAALLGVGSLLLLRPDAVELDAERVVVFPLVDSRAGALDDGAGQQAAIMIGATLDHAEPLRSIDGWDWLEPSLRSDMTSWSIGAGTRIARDRGARFVLDGQIMADSDSIRLMLRLHDASDGALVGRAFTSAEATESSSGLPELARRAVVDLLPSLIDPMHPVPTELMTGFDPLAVAAWLQGEREYRRSNFSEARDLFVAAVAADSTMALAAVRGSQAASWTLQEPVRARMLDAALRHASTLTAKHRLLAEGLDRHHAGAADEAVRLFQQARTYDPEWSDAWMAEGEALYHLFPTGDRRAGYAKEAFENARRFDPGFTPPLVHLAEIALRDGDLEAAQALRLEISGTAGDVVAAVHLELMASCLASGPEGLDWSGETDAAPTLVLGVGVHAGAGGAAPACAVAAYNALQADAAPAFAWSALLGRFSTALAVGDHELTRSLLRSAGSDFPQQQHFLYVLGALVGAPFRPDADDAVLALERQGSARGATRLWSMGVWRAVRGEPEGVAAALELARTHAEESGLAGDSLLVDALAGWMAFARGDSTLAIERFAALGPVLPPHELEWGLWEALPAESLMLARLHLARGTFGDAIRIAERIEHVQPTVYVAYMAQSLQIRREAAEALGQESEAAAYRTRLDRLRTTELPRIRP